MKRQMQTFRGQSEIAVEGHNVKIGRGGIREIEFFAQTQQLIAGGRHPQLRVRPTLEALGVLASSDWITFQARDELAAAYLFLRRVEHRLQMVADEQTHTLPNEVESVERFARFFGYVSRAAFAHDLLRHLNIVQGHYGKLFRRRSDRYREIARCRLQRRSGGRAPARTPRAIRLQEAGHGGANAAALAGRRPTACSGWSRRGTPLSNSFRR